MRTAHALGLACPAVASPLSPLASLLNETLKGESEVLARAEPCAGRVWGAVACYCNVMGVHH